MIFSVCFNTPIDILKIGPCIYYSSLPLNLNFQIYQIVFLNQILNFSMHGLLFEVNKFFLNYFRLVGSLLKPFHFRKPINLLILELAKLHDVNDVLNRKVLRDIWESEAKKLLFKFLGQVSQVRGLNVDILRVWPVQGVVHSSFRILLNYQSWLLYYLSRYRIIALKIVLYLPFL